MATWQDVYDYLGSLTPEQRQQPAEVFRAGKPELEPVTYIGTIGELTNADEPIRSAHAWKRDDAQIVILSDYHPYGPNGEFAFDGCTGEVVMWAPGAGPAKEQGA